MNIIKKVGVLSGLVALLGLVSISQPSDAFAKGGKHNRHKQAKKNSVKAKDAIDAGLTCTGIYPDIVYEYHSGEKKKAYGFKTHKVAGINRKYTCRAKFKIPGCKDKDRDYDIDADLDDCIDRSIAKSGILGMGNNKETGRKAEVDRCPAAPSGTTLVTKHAGHDRCYYYGTPKAKTTEAASLVATVDEATASTPDAESDD